MVGKGMARVKRNIAIDTTEDCFINKRKNGLQQNILMSYHTLLRVSVRIKLYQPVLCKTI
jgi:hypothetical protein